MQHMLRERVEGQDIPIWTDHIKAVMNQYNNKMVHSATGFTPEQARLAKNRLKIKARLEKNETLKNIS